MLDTSSFLAINTGLVAFLLGILGSCVPPGKKLCPITNGLSWCAVAGMLLTLLGDSILLGFALLGIGAVGLINRFSQGGNYHVPR